ncbi:Ribosomal RNA large subunit methyltransferase K/L [Vibrio stylophorae]|uniref:Ribosomal RNA large subunit methyltransferase K/L n=1 Tax=Vibrio stylophorae TaxID=659351 RepID=A0ABN8DWZ4_9VIBR|nr:class I SAM-dependent methyltransferase [Vibrio stylophorae]CAH0533279.1 Ribosomal RNA large subunit methyltransferase K/L [Vibrio stylophorae]
MQLSALRDLFSSLSLPQDAPQGRRLFHGRGRLVPGLEQLTIDYLPPVLWVGLFKSADDAFLDELKSQLVALANSEQWVESGLSSIQLQHRYLQPCEVDLVYGDAVQQTEIQEGDLKFGLRFGRNQNTGLFLDMSQGRQWVQQHSSQARVLNLFAYTCGFSVAAIAGGAKQVVNLDMAKGALSTGRENHQRNGHDLRSVSFLGHDLFNSWGKLKKSGPYEMVVIDPPSFQKGSFALTKDYGKVLRRLDSLTVDGAQVLVCANSPDVTPDYLIDMMAEEAPQFSLVERLANPAVFADVDEQSSLKVMVFVKNKAVDA